MDVVNAYIQNKEDNNGGHLIPQSEYVFDEIFPAKYILRFENLNNDIKLLRRYFINLKLDKKNSTDECSLSISDLDEVSINLINRVYSRDFKDLNYQKIT